MKIYLCCPVRNADAKVKEELDAYVRELEDAGHDVHYPPRDTDQGATGLKICLQNTNAIRDCDEVHVWFDPASTGSHFDLGAAFVLKKPLTIVHNIPFGEGKSFARMITEWEADTWNEMWRGKK